MNHFGYFSERVKDAYLRTLFLGEDSTVLNPLKRTMTYTDWNRQVERAGRVPLCFVCTLPFTIFVDFIYLFLLSIPFLFSHKLTQPFVIKIGGVFSKNILEEKPVVYPDDLKKEDFCASYNLEKVDCDGEYMWVTSGFSGIKGGLFAIFFPTALITVLFGDIWLTMLCVTPLITHVIPSNRGLLFHRRTGLVTFCNGIFLPSVTVHYNTVRIGMNVFGGVNTSTGGSARTRFWVFYSPENIFGYKILASGFGSNLDLVIEAFMDLESSRVLQNDKIRESIRWYQKENKIIWRFSIKSIPGFLEKYYSCASSLYSYDLSRRYYVNGNPVYTSSAHIIDFDDKGNEIVVKANSNRKGSRNNPGCTRYDDC